MDAGNTPDMPCPAPENSLHDAPKPPSELKCSQCKHMKPQSQFIKNGTVLKSCASCLASKKKHYPTQRRKTLQRKQARHLLATPDDASQPRLIVQPQRPSVYDGRVQYDQAVNDNPWTTEWPLPSTAPTPSYNILPGSNKTPVRTIATAVGHQYRKARATMTEGDAELEKGEAGDKGNKKGSEEE